MLTLDILEIQKRLYCHNYLIRAFMGLLRNDDSVVTNFLDTTQRIRHNLERASLPTSLTDWHRAQTHCPVHAHWHRVAPHPSLLTVTQSRWGWHHWLCGDSLRVSLPLTRTECASLSSLVSLVSVTPTKAGTQLCPLTQRRPSHHAVQTQMGRKRKWYNKCMKDINRDVCRNSWMEQMWWQGCSPASCCGLYYS